MPLCPRHANPRTLAVKAGAASRSCVRAMICGGLFLAFGSPRSLTAGPATNALVWPAPPETARIQFVQSIARPHDAGASLPALKKLANWVTGDARGNEPFQKPFGLAFDESSNVCLTDTGANAVSFFDRSEKRWRRWTSVGGVRFASPVSVAKHGGSLYVADSGLGSVVVFGLEGKLQAIITNGLERPVALAVGGEKLFVADGARHGVAIFDLAGKPAGGFGTRGTGQGEFNFPSHIAVAGERLYVTDSMNCRVQVLDLEGHFVRQIGRPGIGPGLLSRPKGVAVDRAGRVFVVDAMSDNFQIFDAEGRLLLVVGSQGTAPGEFWLPNGIAVSGGGEVLIADAYNRRLQRFQMLTPP